MPLASAGAPLVLPLLAAAALVLLLLPVSASNDGSASSGGSSSGGSNNGGSDVFDHCIVGGGPGGVQLAYFLEQSHRSYVVLERGPQAAHFFASYPRHRSLISINKKSTPRHGQHPDFKLRHDWNSLLSTAPGLSSADEAAHARAREQPGLLFGNWSDEYYPSADALVQYVNHFTRSLGLHVRYNTLVTQVLRLDRNAVDNAEAAPSHPFVLYVRDTATDDGVDGGDGRLSCRHVVVATGLTATYSPTNMRKTAAAVATAAAGRTREKEEPLVYGYEEVPLDREFYRGKDVLILGKGNAAFELANTISASSAATSIVSRSELRLSFMTHYPGDVRAVNTRMLDQYQLKSLDQIVDIPDANIDFGSEVTGMFFSRHIDGRVRIQITPQRFNLHDTLPNATQEELAACDRGQYVGRCLLYDVVVRCLGWRFDVSPFGTADDGSSGHQAVPSSAAPAGADATCPRGHAVVSPRVHPSKRKYPDSTTWYESVNEPGVHFAGTLMHLHDFRKAAGGFVHGYRYLIRAFYHHLEQRYYGTPWPSRAFPGCSRSALLAHMLDRVNSASGLYQMFSVLSDVIVLDRATGFCAYLEEVPAAAVTGKAVGGDNEHGVNILDDTLNQQPEHAPGTRHAQFEYLTVFFTYGDDYRGCKVLDPKHRRGRYNDFLHPRVYHYAQSRESLLLARPETAAPFEPVQTHQMKENLDTSWRHPDIDVRPLEKFLARVKLV